MLTNNAVLTKEGVVVNVDTQSEMDRLLSEGWELLPETLFGEYSNFASSSNTQKVNGEWVFSYVPDPSYEETLFKISRSLNVSQIVVEVGGLLFDGDEESQNRMARVVAVALSDDETIEWRLATNEKAMVTVGQLREACRLAGLEQTKLWHYENTNG